MNRDTMFTTAIAIALLVALLATVVLVVRSKTASPAEAQPFTQSVWLDADSSAYIEYDTLTPRQEMYPMLEAQLAGKTEAEVVALLGEPNNKLAETGADLVYVLGPEQGMGVDYEWALIYFNEDGVFERIERTTD